MKRVLILSGAGCPPSSNGSTSASGEPRGRQKAKDGDGCIGSNGGTGNDDEDDDSDSGEAEAAISGEALVSSAGNKKKRKKKPKKKKAKTTPPGQSSPPRVPLHELFPSSDYPVGQLLSYGAASKTRLEAKTSELLYDSRRALEDSAVLTDYRKAAEVHRQVRQWVQETVKPGQTLTEIAVKIEDGVRALLDNAGLEPGHGLRSGIAFPTGLSVNNCVAHYTPNPGQRDVVLHNGDVIKVDFGVHVNGWIVDSAFTMSFNPAYDNLLAAVKDATNTGIRVRKERTPFFFFLTSETDDGFFVHGRMRESMFVSATSAPRSRRPWRATKSRSAAGPSR